MKSRPMIFSAPMVRALLAGKKTQTRRICKPAQDMALSYVVTCENNQWGDEEGDILFGCPCGVVGDRLWVRECYADILWDITASGKEIRKIIYKADEQHDATIIHPTWKTPLFMPLAASRIELEITAIRVERVQDISETDAIAEGCYSNSEYFELAGGANVWPCQCCNGYQVHQQGGLSGVVEVDCCHCDIPKKRYMHLWDSIYAKKHPWTDNPWVWVVEFKVVGGCHEQPTPINRSSNTRPICQRKDPRRRSKTP